MYYENGNLTIDLPIKTENLKKKEIFFIRHAESEFNLTGIDNINTKLTSEGLLQSKRLGERLNNYQGMNVN